MKRNDLKRIGLQFFGMTNLDTMQAARTEIMQRMADAVRDNNTEAFTQAWSDLADRIAEGIRADFQQVQESQDLSILAARGCRALTSVEQRYYSSVIDAMKSDNPKQALTGLSAVLPETTINAVFEDLKTNHPLLAAINFQNTGALVKLLLSSTGGAAAWGEISAEVVSELSTDFIEVDLTLCSLTAFLPVNRHMIDLGPVWLDRYVREVLSEALAVQLETGIVSGNGKNAPIGMNKKLTGAVDGVYSEKETIPVTDLSPETYGSLLAQLSVNSHGKQRNISRVAMIVNPADYYSKLFPATTVRGADGTFNSNVFPFPTDVFPSVGVPSGKMILGICGKYFMGVGTQSGGKIEYSDHYQFLQRVRTYMIALYGYGRALDENDFLYLDISGLKPASLRVEMVSAGG
ncbi:MAG: phage major capsid protein [Oscillospiraceae bacterium]|nr:phage major capsid protein [Oscillospiraceae bacterium]